MKRTRDTPRKIWPYDAAAVRTVDGKPLMTRAEACREAIKTWMCMAYIYGDRSEKAFRAMSVVMNPWVEMWPASPPALDLWRIGLTPGM